MPNKRSNPDFLNGVPELLILRLLSRHAMHGYELVQAMRAATDEALDFGEGCVYPILHRLEADGMLKCRREMAGSRSRLVYRVTARGARRLAETISLWTNVTQAITRALQGDKDVEVQLA